MRCLSALLLLATLLANPAARAENVSLRRLLDGAMAQIGVTLHYDPAYRRIAYPGGDVPLERGVCADVLIRAYRHLGIDLQLLVHEDMEAHFALYPKHWGLTHPDANIDHRRVLNLATFFRRHGTVLPVSSAPGDYRAGDIVTWLLPGGLPHIGIVADQRQDERPLVIHTIGAGTRLEDVLFAFAITGHYRYLPRRG